MTEAQLKFIQLDKKKAEYKEFLKEYKEAKNAIISELGIGGHFQDVEGIVYQTAECDGKFVYFDKFDIERTKRAGERAGSLSVKKAQELGYKV